MQKRTLMLTLLKILLIWISNCQCLTWMLIICKITKAFLVQLLESFIWSDSNYVQIKELSLCNKNALISSITKKINYYYPDLPAVMNLWKDKRNIYKFSSKVSSQKYWPCLQASIMRLRRAVIANQSKKYHLQIFPDSPNGIKRKILINNIKQKQE